MIHLENVIKAYRLGQISHGTLNRDLQSWWARLRHRPDPNVKLGRESRVDGDIIYALNGVSLTARQGECIGIIGGNGAGKSTLLKLVSRVTTPTAGSIDLYGRVTSMLEIGTGFHGEMTGRENIYLNGAILGMSRSEISAKLEEIIDFSEIREFIDTPVKRYSSGMYVKLAFAVASHLDSEIVIMDEVLAGGDAAFQKKCIQKMRSTAMDENRTVLYVSHNMSTVRELCDRCIVLSEGRIIYDGETEEAIRYYRSNLLLANETGEKLDQRPRRSGNLSGLCKMTDLYLVNDVIKGEEPLRFRLRVHAESDFEEICLRMVVSNSIGQIVGMSCSQPFRVSGGTAWYGFSFSAGPLAAGDYVCNLTLLSFDGSIQTRHDFLSNVFSFRIDEAHLYFGQRWTVRNWGNTKLPIIMTEELRDEYRN